MNRNWYVCGHSVGSVQDQDDGRKQGFSWLGFDWGRKGGLQARELALWVQLQREFRRRNLLGTDAIKRLQAIGFIWEPEVTHTVLLTVTVIVTTTKWPSAWNGNLG